MKLEINEKSRLYAAIATILILSIAGSMLIAPSVNGAITAVPGVADGTHIPTHLYLNVGPNPIGIGQTLTLNAFFGSAMIDSEIPSKAHPENYNVTITTPSGNNSTLSLIADKTGGGYITYVPTTVGTYTFQAYYGGQPLLVPGWVGMFQDPAVSTPVTVSVQEDPVTKRAYPFTPLPNNWWESPVAAQNTQNWYKIMGPNFFTNQYNCTTVCNPYTDPVLSAHTLWTKPWIAGGVAGGDLGGGEDTGNYWTVRQYEQPFSPIVIDGKFWSQQQPQSSSTNNGILCVDLKTGEEIYRINTTGSISFGMNTAINFPNGYGAVPYVIWTTGALTPAETGGKLIPNVGTQYNMYDGLTGIYICSIVNGSSLTNLNCRDGKNNVVGYYINSTVGTLSIWTQKLFDTTLADGTSAPSGPQLQEKVTISTGERYLCAFNFTKALWNAAGSSGGLQIAKNTAIDFRLGIMYAEPIPTTLDGKEIKPNLAIDKCSGNQVFLSSYVFPTFYWTSGWDVICAMNADTGAVTWIKNYTYPDYQWLLPWQNVFTQSPGVTNGNMFIEACLNNMVVQGFDADTGNSKWTTTLKTPYGDGTPNRYDELAKGLGTTPVPFSYDNQLVLFGFGGDIWNLNMTNGDTIWYTNTTTLLGDPGLETPYNIWPIWTAQCPSVMAPGIIYFAISHMYNPPMFHGGQILAVNLTTGEKVWSVLSFPMTGQAMAYGVLLHLNGYDGQVWAYGKGPSATTVTAPNIGVTTSTPITITGTVLDISPGTTQHEQKTMFPYGVPCVSEESQSAFMEYVYENQAAPSNATGVAVTISVLDNNGNFRDIGVTTSDPSGAFSYIWTPDISGKYTVYASFAGSNSYYGSSAQTAIYASEPTSTAAASPQVIAGLATTNDLYLVGAVIAVIIVIIGAVLGMLMLKKRA